MPRKRYLLALLTTVLVLVTSLAAWIQWGGWPDPQQKQRGPAGRADTASLFDTCAESSTFEQ